MSFKVEIEIDGHDGEFYDGKPAGVEVCID